MRLGNEYFDDSRQPPSDATPGFSTSQHWRAFFRYFRMPRRPYPDSEEGIQQRPFLSLKLENLDFSETGVFINHFGKTTSDLGGISNPLLANKGSQTLGADHRARLVFDFQKGTGYLLTDSAFQFNSTTAPGLPGIPSLANNVLGFEGGGTLRLPVPRNRNGLKSTPPAHASPLPGRRGRLPRSIRRTDTTHPFPDRARPKWLRRCATGHPGHRHVASDWES